MPAIANPTLTASPVPGHPGHRLLEVGYDLVTEVSDPHAGYVLDEQIVVRSIDLDDAPTATRPYEVELTRGPVTVAAGSVYRRLSRAVPRIDLDVGQDWWDTGPSGETTAIAEFADHLIAEIVLRRGPEVVATATTEVLTGSWGALGQS